MSDPKILYTLIGYKNKILTDYYEKGGELVNYMRETIFPATKEIGKKIINSQNQDFAYVRGEDQIVVLIALNQSFNKEIAL